MAEPRVQRVTYEYGGPNREVRIVNIRRNRTEAETSAQFNRLYSQIATASVEERDRIFRRLSSAYQRVMGGLAATGRSPEWADAYRRIRNR